MGRLDFEFVLVGHFPFVVATVFPEGLAHLFLVKVVL